MSDIILDPLLSEVIEAGDQALLQDWRVSEGDHVKMGQSLAQVRVLGESLDIRAPHAGTGKSGGVRVIYYVRTAQEDLVLLTLYAKSKTAGRHTLNFGGALPSMLQAVTYTLIVE